MPSRPSSPSFGHRSRGNSFLRSISSARGAILALREAPHAVAQHVDVFAEAEIESGPAIGDHGASSERDYLAARFCRRVGRIFDADHGREHARDQLGFRRLARASTSTSTMVSVRARAQHPAPSATKRSPTAGDIRLILSSTVSGAEPSRHQRIGGKAGRGIGKRGGDAAMQEAALLARDPRRIFSATAQCAGRERRDLAADQRHERLAREALAHAGFPIRDCGA